MEPETSHWLPMPRERLVCCFFLIPYPDQPTYPSAVVLDSSSEGVEIVRRVDQHWQWSLSLYRVLRDL